MVRREFAVPLEQRRLAHFRGKMSRGRGGGAGRGAGRGRGGHSALPAGFSFEDMLAASQAREPAPLYPVSPFSSQNM